MSSTVYVPRGARNNLGGRNQIVAAATDPIRPVRVAADPARIAYYRVLWDLSP
jgi:hypothetical protein